MGWPLRDLFIAYSERMKESARRAYEHDLLMWATLAAAGAKVKRPDPPAILGLGKRIIGG